MERVHESTSGRTSKTASFVLFVAVLLAFVVETQATQVSDEFNSVAIISSLYSTYRLHWDTSSHTLYCKPELATDEWLTEMELQLHCSFMLLVVFPDSFGLYTTQDEAWPPSIINRTQICSHSTDDCLEIFLLDWKCLHGKISRSRHLYHGILRSPWSAVVYCGSPGFVRYLAYYLVPH